MANQKLEHGCLVKWRGRLEEARKRGYFTLDELSEAENWDLCAVGEAHTLNPKIVKYSPQRKNESGRSLSAYPVDTILDTLGLEFCISIERVSDTGIYIRVSGFDAVEHCLDKIEKRLEELYDLAQVSTGND